MNSHHHVNFIDAFSAVLMISGLALSIWFGACEIVHRWESRAPMRHHPGPCQDTTELVGMSERMCHKDASGSLETIGGNSFWVCRCARDGGAP